MASAKNKKQVLLNVDRALLGQVQRGATFLVKDEVENAKLGGLTIGQGGLYWRVGSENPHFVSWDKFIKWMNKSPQVTKPKKAKT